MLTELPAPVPVKIEKNVFVGYPMGYPFDASVITNKFDHHGDLALHVAFSELLPNFSISIKAGPETNTSPVLGMPAHSHAAASGARRAKETIGAAD